jgi:hypothetical protein
VEQPECNGTTGPKSSNSAAREMFNAGECDPICHEADGSFRLGPEPEWTAQCEQLRKRLGEWRSFKVRKSINCATDYSQICTIGLASFANGSYRLQVAWHLKNAKPLLFALFLGDPRALILNWEPFLREPQLVALR